MGRESDVMMSGILDMICIKFKGVGFLSDVWSVFIGQKHHAAFHTAIFSLGEEP
jgi:hypothetical protein